MTGETSPKQCANCICNGSGGHECYRCCGHDCWKAIPASTIGSPSKPPITTGVKHDQQKIRPNLVLGDFSNALTAVCEVGAFGADKYAPHNWLVVPNGIERYTDAMLRHWLEQEEVFDSESGFEHAAHCAWNALARLELMIRAKKDCAKLTEQS